MTPDPQTPFERRSKALFDESVDNLSGNIRSRLTQARHRALEQASVRGTNRHISNHRVWLPAAALTAAAVAAVVVVAPRVIQERGMPEAFAADDFALLLNDDDLDLIENMEFYAWVEDNLDAADAAREADDART